MIRGYGLFSLIELAVDLLVTRLLYRKARIVRRPFSIKGRLYIDYGENFTTGRYCRIDAMPQCATSDKLIVIGNNCQINDSVHIAAIQSVTIGNNVLIASRVFITDHNHGSYSDVIHSSPLIPPSSRPLFSSPIHIEDNVWIGEGVCILPGVRVGSGSVVGANSVVTKSIPPNSIVVGVPAKIIKRFNFELNVWE